MKTKILTAAIISTFLLSMPALAEQGKGDGFKGDGHKGAKMEALDENGDGLISKDEFMSGHIKRFEKIDANADGNISKEELEAYREAKRAARMEKMMDQKSPDETEEMPAEEKPAAE